MKVYVISGYKVNKEGCIEQLKPLVFRKYFDAKRFLENEFETLTKGFNKTNCVLDKYNDWYEVNKYGCLYRSEITITETKTKCYF